MKNGKQIIRESKYPKYLPYMKANTKYVDISMWTTIMSRRNAGPFLEFFNHLMKVIIMMKAYVVTPGGIRWEERRIKILLNIFTGFLS